MFLKLWNLPRLLLYAALAAGGIHLGVFLFVAFSRMGYRYELEWTEGSILVQVSHILKGFPIYTSPTPEYVPYVYTPFYFWFSSLFAFFGGGFFPLRLVSFLSIGLALVLCYRWILATTGSRLGGLLAAFLFIASFRPTGFWFDLARVDSLALFFLLLGLRFVHHAPSLASGIIAALAFTLAFFTKQTSLAVIISILPYVLLKGFHPNGEETDRPRQKVFLFAFIFSLVIGIVGWIFFLNWKSGGWFNYYVFRVSAGHAFIPGAWLTFWTEDLLRHFALPLGLAFWAILSAYKSGGIFSDALWFRLCSTAGMLGTAWITRTHVGSWDNVLMPAFAWLALMSGWGIVEFLPLRGWKGIGLGLALLFQFAILGYKPWTQIPNAADRAEGQAIESRIKRIDGNVWIPDHEYLAEWTGKKTFGNRMPLEDLRRGWGGMPKKKQEDSLRTLLKKKQFAAILLDAPDWRDAGMFPEEMGEYYALADSLPLAGRAFYPKTGVKSRPIYFYLPKP